MFRQTLRLFAVLPFVGTLFVAPNVAAQDDAPLAPIVGSWDHHGFFVQVNDDGSSTATWRTYNWCGPGVPQPCDELTNNQIIDGGHADLSFSGPDESGAFHGQVSDTSDPTGLDLGDVTLTPQPYDMLLLEQGDFQLILCGDDALNQAPSDVLEQCGA